jgi:Tol biopolymer transport system component
MLIQARLHLVLAAAVAVLATALALPAAGHALPLGATTVIDRTAGFGPLPGDGDNDAYGTSQSADGRYVAFQSQQDALLPPGADRRNVGAFVRDTQTGTTVDVCVNSQGQPADDDCGSPSLSADGKVVAFESQATNLDPADVNGQDSIFVRNLQTGKTVLASRANGMAGAGANAYAGAPSLSGDGTKVAFESDAAIDPNDTGNHRDVYVRDLTAGTTKLLSQRGGTSGNGYSEYPRISADGTEVVFHSSSTNLDPLDPNTDGDVYEVASAGSNPTLVSRSAADVVGNSSSEGGTLSTTGQYVAFSSSASNLVAGDANGKSDTFVRNMATGTVTLVSRADGVAGAQTDDDSYGGYISADGHLVAFSSEARNLGSAPKEDYQDLVWLRDVTAGTTRLVSRGTGAAGAAAEGAYVADLSADGGAVLFTASGIGQDAGPHDNGTAQVFQRVVAANVTRHVSRPSGTQAFSGAGSDAYAGEHATSADGRFVVFGSDARFLVPGTTRNCGHVFRRDTITGAVQQVDLTPAGKPTNGCAGDSDVSADGRYVAFTSSATNLDPAATDPDQWEVFVRDMQTGAVTLASRGSGNAKGVTSVGEDDFVLSRDGRHLAFATVDKLDPADTNAAYDVYVRDLTTGVVTYVSRANGKAGVGSDAGGRSAMISDDGKIVAFSSQSTNLGDGDTDNQQDVHVRNLTTATNVLVDRANGAGGAKANAYAGGAGLSGDGTRVLFRTQATNLGDGASGAHEVLHVRNVATGSTTWVSRGVGGAEPNTDVGWGTLSRDGTRVAYTSDATNIVTGDTNGAYDAFLVDVAHGATSRLSVGVGGAQANGDTDTVGLSANGSCAVLLSRATNLESPAYPSPDYRHLHLKAIGSACAVPTVVKPPPVDRTAPVVSLLKLAPAKVAAKHKTAVTFRSTEAGTATIAVARVGKGRRVGKGKKARCVKPTHRNHRSKRCTRRTALGTVTAKAVHGNTRITFTGRVGKKRLTAGTYRLTVTVTDAHGNRSKAKTATLTVLPAR